jgi:ribulose-5-phosphate 4-epimerase/fuculose-1-phosphate aldolase
MSHPPLPQVSTRPKAPPLHHTNTISVLDAYGHLSVRHPHHPERFIMSRYIAPATIASERDLNEYWIENAEPVDPNSSKGYSERCIHSEILKRFPDVNAVIHSHSQSVVPYSISGVPFQAAFHLGGFIGTKTPNWDIAKHYQKGDMRDLLVRNTKLGAALAMEFGSGDAKQPSHAVVLMRGHGFTVQGPSIVDVVMRAVYTQQNANILTTAMLTRAAHFGSGPQAADAPAMMFLSEEETEGATEMTIRSAYRPWGLWLREVEANPLYINQA